MREASACINKAGVTLFDVSGGQEDVMMNRRLLVTLCSLAALTATDALADSNYCVKVETQTTAYSCNPDRCDEQEWTFEIGASNREYGVVDDDHPDYWQLSDYEGEKEYRFWAARSALSHDNFPCKDNLRRR